MTKIFAKSALAGAAGIMALSAAAAIPSFASAQSGYYGQSYDSGYYDPCRRSSSNRSTTGGLIGALAGAAIGSNVAARNARTEGAVLGGLVGAVAGSKIGKDSAACAPSRQQGYYNGGSQYGSNGYYGGSGYYGSNYDNGYGDRTYDYDRSSYYGDQAYDRRGNSYSVSTQSVGADGCTLAESPIYLPDGQVQKRFVRVCRDNRGRYQVVD
ncbi:MAG: glycine zipper 2TM domain-containing protein [Phenylobacterium sp.]|uniref:glycine zipper 2TM domain-containing protein n=1 Tax=Phenylobacterium sp. TaxID=1871053 RepID=UPI001B5B1F4F|nr:glycine zipper 2TM domain-containing protein [Phenylobacterium sp.]MBP7815959.1 glycine zipper 2TM domain-containing protein [Phenylobacterium sp.]MBP9231849.1 glycine zipper 2TM domain-containing protein [Phenylobacterium sp.]